MVFVAPPPALPLVTHTIAPEEDIDAPKGGSVGGANGSSDMLLLAQAVIPEAQTAVDINGGQITISGGQQAGANLFYGFEQFNVPTDATADFLADPAVQRVVGHVTGGDGSNIDGLLTITGGDADLFIINPAGILFGPNAQLDLPATFTATTAHGVGFGERWFSATGENAIQELSEAPSGLAFSESSAAIVNLADLSTTDGLLLAAGTVVDLGSLRSQNGAVQILSRDSGAVVLRDGLLRLDLAPASLPPESLETAASLADLLTGGTAEQAAQITVDEQGNVFLANVPIAAGDGVVSQLNGQSALVVAGNTLHLPGSALTTSDGLTLVGEQVYITDSEAQPLTLRAGERLTIQGRDGIDVLALYNDQTVIAGGEVLLASDGEISLDAHISSRGDVGFTTLDNGQTADFISLYDPIISADGNVSFGSYSGPALKVEATGSILVDGDITITGPDTTLSQFVNWESIGDVSIETSQFGFGPGAAPSQVLLDLGSSAVSRAELETFLGLPAGALNGLGSGTADEGSAIATTFSAQTGDTVSFDWNFVTNNVGTFAADDFVFVTLTGVTTAQLADSNDLGLVSNPDRFENFPRIGFFSGSDAATGLQSFATNIPADGDYTLGIGLVRQTASNGNSVALIDNVLPEPTLIADESLLATTPALILRAGETTLQNMANLPQLNQPDLNTDFVETATGTTPASITVNGEISTENNDFDVDGGSVILTAPGAVTLNGNVNTRAPYSGNIVITGSEITAQQLNAGGGFQNPSQVVLTSTEGNTIVETISAGSGGVDISAAGFFQATDTFEASVRITLDPVEDAELIAFLQAADPDAFSQIDLNEQIQILIPASIAASPDAGEGRIRIRHGAAGMTASNEDYDIEGTGVVSSTPFFVGPNAENVTITINPEMFGFQATVSGFTPLFDTADFPTNASGTNGAIAQLTGDGSLATAFFNEPFVPEIPVVPEPPGPQPPGPQPPGPQPPGPQPTTTTSPEFSTADTDNLEEEETEDEAVATNTPDNLLALRGVTEDCDADELTEENGVTRLSGDCLEENSPDTPQSVAPNESSNEAPDEFPNEDEVSLTP
ncbi:MAG: filamentous hemagglutinin N-terminal domain-containing protein [Cyanobacteria bacterium J06554_1]